MTVKKLELEIRIIPTTDRKLITSAFKKDLCEVLEKHFKHEWMDVSYDISEE